MDVSLFGMNPTGHHLHSLVLHLINAVLLFLLLAFATGRAWQSWTVAALFALHPLNVEAVAWAAERKTVLSTLFFLLAAAAYGWYAKRPRPGRYLAVACLFVLGLAAKPMVITLPFVFLLLDWWPLRRIESWTTPGSLPQLTAKRLALEKLPLIALSLCSAVITLAAQQAAVNPAPFELRFGNAMFSYCRYILTAVWPSNLAVFYPLEAVSWWLTISSFASLAAISALCWYQRFRRPWLITAWLFYLGTLLPMIGLIQVGAQAMADRYLYLSAIGLFVIAVWGINEELQRRRISPCFGLAAITLVLLILGALTWRQVGFWRDGVQLWGHAVAVTDENTFAEDGLGDALLRENKSDEALVHFKKAALMNPTDPTSGINIGADLQDHGRLDEAISEYESVLPGTEDNHLRAILYGDLGNAYRKKGDLAAAQTAYLEALKLQPDSMDAAQRLGRLRIEIAVQRLREQIGEHPSATGYVQLGDLLTQLGHTEEAREAYLAALKLDPQMAAARDALLRIGQSKP